MNNLTELQAKHETLIKELINPMAARSKAQIFAEIKANESELNKVKAAQLLHRVNREQAKKREFAAQAWDAEEPTEDITTNDGSLHKTKAKKYPKLSSIQYGRFEFKDGLLVEMRINGERFNMYKTKYEYGKQTEYTRPSTFAEFLELNSINAEDISQEQFAEFAQKLKAETDKLEAAIKAYDNARKSLDCYQFQHVGLVDQNTTHTYTYSAKKY